MRRRAGCGAFGESGENRKWMFRFAEWRAEEERTFALTSVEVSATWDSADPLEGDMLVIEYGCSWLVAKIRSSKTSPRHGRGG